MSNDWKARILTEPRNDPDLPRGPFIYLWFDSDEERDRCMTMIEALFTWARVRPLGVITKRIVIPLKDAPL